MDICFESPDLDEFLDLIL